MADTGTPPSIAPYAKVFNAAIRDFAGVVQGQIVSANAEGEALASAWLEAATDLLTSLDGLKHDMAEGDDPARLRNVVQAFTAQTETRTLSLMSEIQRHDKFRQMLESVAQMVGEIGKLDLTQIAGSIEAAAKPSHIIETAAEHYVTAEQRFTHRTALTKGSTPEGPELELF